MVKGWNPILFFIMFPKDKTASFLKSHKLTEIEEKGEKVNEKIKNTSHQKSMNFKFLSVL